MELGPEGITVNCICPGPIDTAMTSRVPIEDKQRYARRRTALGRYGLPVHTMDETLSTRESKTLYYESRAKNSKGFGAVKDILAAQLILQTWLDTAAQQERQNG